MNNWRINDESVKASEIIKTKLKANGGCALIKSFSSKTYEIKAAEGGKSFICNGIPITPPYTYEVFDIIVDLLIKEGGEAYKGTGRNARIGQPKCDETTVVGAIGIKYHGKQYGESTYDPVFVLAAVLEWADIAYNKRGYLELAKSFKDKI